MCAVVCGPEVTCEFLQHFPHQETLVKNGGLEAAAAVWLLWVCQRGPANNCRTFLTKYRVRAVSQQKGGCVSGNVCTFLEFGGKPLVGKTIRLKTSADIQHVKNVMPTLTKTSHEPQFGKLWYFVNHYNRLIALLTTWEQFVQSKSFNLYSIFKYWMTNFRSCFLRLWELKTCFNHLMTQTTKISPQLLNELSYNLVQTLMVPRGWIPLTLVIPTAPLAPLIFVLKTDFEILNCGFLEWLASL